jgi:lipopolysaccharide transport system permease protein
MTQIIRRKKRQESLYTHYELLIAWVIRTIRARYQQSLLGGLWAILQPAATAVVFSIVFTYFIPVQTEGVPYIVFSYTAMVPWTLFSASIVDMVESLVINMNLVSKVYFPREILPVSALLARVFDFIIASSVLAALMIWYRIPVSLFSIAWLPIILLTQLILGSGIGLIGSALNVFYRDIRHLFLLGLQIWMYVSPVIYPVSAIPPELRGVYYINPMAGIIQAYRQTLLYQHAPDVHFLVSVVISLLIFAFGYWFFKKVEYQFADVV